MLMGTSNTARQSKSDNFALGRTQIKRLIENKWNTAQRKTEHYADQRFGSLIIHPTIVYHGSDLKCKCEIRIGQHDKFYAGLCLRFLAISTVRCAHGRDADLQSWQR